MPERMAILVPWLDRIQHGPAMLQSVMGQTSKDWKCFIRDDGSTDGAKDLQRAWVGRDPRFTLVDSYPGERLGITRNSLACMEAAAAEGFDICGLLDSDDILEPTAVEEVLWFYAEPPYKGFVYTQFIFSNNSLSKRGQGLCKPIAQGLTLLDGSGYVGHFETFRASEYRRSVGVDPVFDQGFDKALAYVMEEVTRLHFLDRPLYWWRGWAEGSYTADTHRRGITGRHTRGARREAARRRALLPPGWLDRRT